MQIRYNGVQLHVKQLEIICFGVVVCEHEPSGDLYVEYLVSTGPYKVDVLHVDKLSQEECQRYRDGSLDFTKYTG